MWVVAEHERTKETRRQVGESEDRRRREGGGRREQKKKKDRKNKIRRHECDRHSHAGGCAVQEV